MAEEVVKYDELDKGFILRAGSEEIAKLLKRIIKKGPETNHKIEVEQMDEEEDQKNEDVEMDNQALLPVPEDETEE